MKKTVITGGTGFLGMAIVRIFAQDSSREIIAVDVDIDKNNDYKKEVTNIKYVQGSVEDATFCDNIIAEADELIICHMIPHPYNDCQCKRDC
ncbi:NAD-dependent epimerase/dehydratase family protein [Lentisphaerota bacterium WC36G]